jgi:hypothetical protein
MNSAHPFENPTGLTNFFVTLAMMMFPFALGADVWPDAGAGLRHSPRHFFGHAVADGRHRRLVGLFRHPEAEPGLTAHRTARTYQIPSAAAQGRATGR